MHFAHRFQRTIAAGQATRCSSVFPPPAQDRQFPEYLFVETRPSREAGSQGMTPGDTYDDNFGPHVRG
jgi:hypothetical protein